MKPRMMMLFLCVRHVLSLLPNCCSFNNVSCWEVKIALELSQICMYTPSLRLSIHSIIIIFFMTPRAIETTIGGLVPLNVLSDA